VLQNPQYQITLAVYHNAKTPWKNISEWLPANIQFVVKDTLKDNSSSPTIEYYFNDDKFNECSTFKRIANKTFKQKDQGNPNIK